MKRRMQCNCCGEYAGRWKQHPNRDTGYGMCFKCIQWVRSRGMSEAEIVDLYGIEGVNWGMDNEYLLGMLEHAISYMSYYNEPDTTKILYTAYKSIEPYGEIPSWEGAR